MKKKNDKAARILTKRNWSKELEVGFDGDFTLLYGYIDCIERICPVLEKMANKAKTFEGLKDELLKFIVQQNKFVEDVKDKRSSVHAGKYGLPQIPR